MRALLECFGSATSSDKTVLCDRTRKLSASELTQQVRMLAGLLKARGCRRVALQADNDCDWIIADLACQEAGIPCVPIPLFFTRPQQLHVLHTCGIDALLTQLPEGLGMHFIKSEAVESSTLLLLLQPASHTPLLPERTSKITFTSGSTGAPKGVCLSAAQQWSQADALRKAVRLEKPVHLCVLPLATLLENVAGVYAPLLAGGTVILRRMDELGFSGSRLDNPRSFLQVIADVGPDTLIVIPQLLQLLVNAVQQGWHAPSLKFIAVGGARVSAALILRARALGLPVYEGYGLSECASVVSLNTPDADLPGSCGRVLQNFDATIVDGEITVGGNRMLGYVGETSTWNSRPIATGDLGHFDENGFLHIDGRRKNLLISSYGRNISPEWVESELLASPVIAEAVVFGDGRPNCVALLSPARPDLDDGVLTKAISEANRHLPDYARVKHWLRLQRPLAAAPGLFTSNGRPRRDRIAALYRSQIDSLYKHGGASDCLSISEELQ